MKFEIREFTVDKKEWLTVQNNVLSYLESNKREGQKIDQKLILTSASNAYMDSVKQKLMEEMNLKDADKIAFLPVPQDVKFTIEDFSFKLKVFYENNLEKYNLDIKPEPFKLLSNDYNAKIDEFYNLFISGYKFKLNVDRDVVETNDNVIIETKPADMQEAKFEKYQIIANPESEHQFEKQLIGAKLGEVITVNYAGRDFLVKPIQIVEIKEMPITAENVHLLNIDQIKNMDDVRKYVEKTILEQIVNDSVFAYGENILSQLLKEFNQLLEIDDELIENDMKEFRFKEDFAGDKREVVKSTIMNYFWTMLFNKKIGIKIEYSEMEEERQKLFTIFGEKANQFGVQAISNIVLLKKLGTYYLSKNEPAVFEENKEYLQKYLSK
ncbi:hypothetical protein VBM90_02285 [Mycoplasma sp. 2704]|uniref:trigger factor-related chaperone n=1 Tax=unclassified Mycoplasma TaxID=2683645 RepID=UPI002B1E5F9E|nr:MULTISPECIES: hypothetical protein [unclassified Mycoplasma]MEA4134627.1 hypothetical protein [Mycoplasma sp. 2704]MEA4333801.1 hypothetical protein [Mycoplasma sp. 1232]